MTMTVASIIALHGRNKMTKLKINHVYLHKETGELYLCEQWNNTLMFLHFYKGFIINWNDNWFIDLGEL